MAVYTQIDDPSAYFKVQLYSGNASAGRAIAFDDTDTDMQPDLVFIFARGGNEYPSLYDSARGTQKLLRLDNDDPPSTESGTDGLTAFSSDGFTIGGDENVNNTSETFVAWCWKESATAGFDIVTYTGSGSARTISHSLSAVPHAMIVKNLSDGGYNDGTSDWCVYNHRNTSAPETDYLKHNTTAATADLNTIWNDTAPTSSVFSVGTNDQVNENTDSFINYLWSEKQGFFKAGVYTGNGNIDSPFIYLGFRPALVIIKKSSGAGDGWMMFDNKREGFNAGDGATIGNNWLPANEEDTAESANGLVDFLSNGFKVRSTHGGLNDSTSSKHTFMAWAESPFVNSKGVPCNAR